MTNNQSQRGFTLLETLIVLLIVTLILPISLRQYRLVSEKQQLDAFTEQLEDVLYYAQMTAIAEEQYVGITINNDLHIVDVTMGFQRLKRINVKKSIKLGGGTLDLQFGFSKNGSLVGKAGTLFVKTEHFSKKMTFLLGQGRFYVETV